MITLREIFTAFAPEYLERYPTLPTAHRQVISALQPCQSGAYGHSLYQCQHCAGQHRVNHSCGAPMRVVMRVWTSPRACVDTG